MTTRFKLYENNSSDRVWLFPTDERFESAIKSVGCLDKYLSGIKQNFPSPPWPTVKDYLIEYFFKSKFHNYDYIFICLTDHDWIWYSFCKDAFDWMKRSNLKFEGHVDISDNEYNRAVLELDIKKYNL